jgi:hypothetical protein
VGQLHSSGEIHVPPFGQVVDPSQRAENIGGRFSINLLINCNLIHMKKRSEFMYASNIFIDHICFINEQFLFKNVAAPEFMFRHI